VKVPENQALASADYLIGKVRIPKMLDRRTRIFLAQTLNLISIGAMQRWKNYLMLNIDLRGQLTLRFDLLVR